MPNSEPEPFGLAEHLVEASTKLTLLDKLLASVLPQGKRVLIFSGFTRMLDILEDFLNLRSIGHLRLDGQTSRPRRNLNIRLFQTSFVNQASKPVFLISTKAGGLGINLTAADTVVLFDSSWNPQVDIQAIARAHRIGQTAPVTVYRLICAASVEEQMLSRLRKKLYLSLKILESRAPANGLTESVVDVSETEEKLSMSTAELCAILRGGARVFEASSSNTNTNEAEAAEADEISSGYRAFVESSFEQIVEKAREESKRAVAKRGGEEKSTQTKEDEEKAAAKEEMELLQGMEVVRTRVFEGRQYVVNRTQKQIGEEWAATMKGRKRIERTQIVNGHAVEICTLGNTPWEAVRIESFLIFEAGLV